MSHATDAQSDSQQMERVMQRTVMIVIITVAFTVVILVSINLIILRLNGRFCLWKKRHSLCEAQEQGGESPKPPFNIVEVGSII